MTDTTSISAVVLVVDDSPESLGMLNMALGQAGFTVLVALNGIQALSIIDKILPDVILLDAIMPEMDGFETCKNIKITHPDIPVIFMTGLSEEENIVSGFEAGGVDYITKPIKPSEVIARIKVHVTNARLTQSAQAALDSTGQHILSLDDSGNVIWATQQANNLLNFIHDIDSQLSDWLKQEMREPLLFNENEKVIQITYLSAQNEHEHLIQLSEQDSRIETESLIQELSVTKREAEVLIWISRGKTNREIAQILKISPRTVNKHLEVAFRKLEVDNRTAAAAICLRVLKQT